ncbi:hypothetical protein BDAP_000598 [Binucleata daphniae]
MGAVIKVNKSFFEKLKKLNAFETENCEKKVKDATYAQNVSYNRGLSPSLYVFKYGKMYGLGNVFDSED